MPSAWLIVGAGFLGRALAARLREDAPVYATTRSPQRAAELSQIGCLPLWLDVTSPVSMAALRPVLTAPSLGVAYLVPPGRIEPHRVLTAGLDTLIKALRDAPVEQAVLASSTAVYGEHEGAWVSADTPPQPADLRSRWLAEAETRWLDAGPAYRVLRLAGLYGPGRIIGYDALREGAPLAGRPDAWLNLIHVDDAAQLCHLMLRGRGGRVELGADGSPVPRLTYYTHLARLMGVAPPALAPRDDPALDTARARSTGDKRCDIRPTVARTGFAPAYPDYAHGLAALLSSTAP